MRTDVASGGWVKVFMLCSGLFNIVFAFPLITPVAELYLSAMTRLNHFLGLGNQVYDFTQNPTHLLLINTAGIDLVLIGSVIIYASFDPVARKGLLLLNAVGRTLFFMIIAHQLAFKGLMPLFLVFGIIDAGISVVFVRLYAAYSMNGVKSDRASL